MPQFQTKVDLVSVLAYATAYPDLLDAIKRFVTADDVQTGWRALDDIRRFQSKD